MDPTRETLSLFASQGDKLFNEIIYKFYDGGPEQAVVFQVNF